MPPQTQRNRLHRRDDRYHHRSRRTPLPRQIVSRHGGTLDRDNPPLDEALSPGTSSLCSESLGVEPKLHKFRRGKIAKATCRTLKLDDVVVTELLHVVADMALISPVSMSEER